MKELFKNLRSASAWDRLPGKGLSAIRRFSWTLAVLVFQTGMGEAQAMKVKVPAHRRPSVSVADKPLVLPSFPLLDTQKSLQKLELKSGLRVFLEERHDQPLIRLELRSSWPVEELEGRTWAVGALKEALEGGAGRMNQSAFARSLEESAIKLKWGWGERHLSCALLADSRSQEAAFEHLAHAVFRPEYDREGPEASKLALADRIELHRCLMRPERSVLMIRGDLDLNQAKALAMLYLGTWAPKPGVMPKLPERKTARRSVAPLTVTGAKERAPHLILSYLLEREAGKVGVDLKAKREDGQPSSIFFDQGALPWIKALCKRGFTSADLQLAKSALLFERISIGLHPELQLALRAQVELLGDPGALAQDVTLESLNKALQDRLGAF